METNYFIPLIEIETVEVEGGSYLSFGFGFVYEAIRVYGGQALDWIGNNYNGNETLMNCI
ncbi:MAG TPA: hypothetical protein GX708_19855 [Gallicola sp.]|nr:hypothetical protein [Gallicola sp.]